MKSFTRFRDCFGGKNVNFRSTSHIRLLQSMAIAPNFTLFLQDESGTLHCESKTGPFFI